MDKLKALKVRAGRAGRGAAAAAEFILEGLYAHRRISRNEERGFAAEERKREPPRAKRTPRTFRRQYN